MRSAAIAGISFLILIGASGALGAAHPAAKEGAEIVRKGAVIAQNVQSMLKQAQKDGDMIMIDCLNKKLSQISANLKNASERLDQLNSPGAAQHQLAVLKVLGQKMSVLDQEARQCAGQGMFETGKVKVVTETDLDKLPSTDIFFRAADIFRTIVKKFPPTDSTPTPASGVK